MGCQMIDTYLTPPDAYGVKDVFGRSATEPHHTIRVTCRNALSSRAAIQAVPILSVPVHVVRSMPRDHGGIATDGAEALTSAVTMPRGASCAVSCWRPVRSAHAASWPARSTTSCRWLRAAPMTTATCNASASHATAARRLRMMAASVGQSERLMVRGMGGKKATPHPQTTVPRTHLVRPRIKISGVAQFCALDPPHFGER